MKSSKESESAERSEQRMRKLLSTMSEPLKEAAYNFRRNLRVYSFENHFRRFRSRLLNIWRGLMRAVDDMRRSWAYDPSQDFSKVFQAMFPGQPGLDELFSGKRKQIPQEEIEALLKRIHEQTPQPPTSVNGLYELPRWMETEAQDSDFAEPSLQRIAEHMAAFLGIHVPVKVRVTDWNDNENHAGSYQAKNQWQREICIRRNKEFRIENIVAILAHESTHHYMHEHRMDAPDPAQNEILTDLVAVYLGFGSPLYYGYHTSRMTYYIIGFYERNVRLGYITPETVKLAAKIAARLRGWLP
ncbi:hypothetical protein AUJ46_01100 [Candidatus Peregrinibacteria bacterium CG1_02_54_53]|nr:MAG: hypothetical protein AUJ46_01100 [Candidatus Peregrinibacteria bacterium CG1_02_54_53]